MRDDVPVTHATGMGSWPGTDPREAIVTIRDLMLGDGPADHLAYLPETPDRGPGADLIGRGAGLLTEMPVELHPSGWRLTGRPGRDAERTASLWRQDLDELAEAYEGYAGPLTIAVAGPWTLASSIELPGGERAIVDPGAAREVAESLADGIASLVSRLTRLIPGVEVVLQLDEPSLPAVLAGTIPTASGYSRHRRVDGQVALTGLQTTLAGYAGPSLIHCCHPDAPIPLLRQAGAGGLALDLTEASAARWESVALILEEGQQIYAGLLRTDGTTSVAEAARSVVEQAERVGIERALLDGLIVSPACGLAGRTLDSALATQRAAIALAGEVAELLDR